MGIEPTIAADEGLVDAIARRVVELLREPAAVNNPGNDAGAESPCLTVSQVASRYRVSRSWVYAHQRALGAMRLGDGPRARLRFDPDVVAEAVAAFDRSHQPSRSPDRERRPQRSVRLIEFEKLT